MNKKIITRSEEAFLAKYGFSFDELVKICDCKLKSTPYSLEVNENDLKGELWKIALTWRGKYQASNYGRIKIKISGEYKIAHQTTHPDYGEGWQTLEIHPSVLVYLIVADAWLNKPEGDNLELHHINNDGRDNSIKNLIYLPKSLHLKIHNESKKNKIYNKNIIN